jgi:hypothetical protein
MAKTKTTKPITKQNDAELRLSTDANSVPTPIAYDDVKESTGTKYSFPEAFEQVDDQHSRVPGTDPSTKGAYSAVSKGGMGTAGPQIAMNRDIASLKGPTAGYAYADQFGTQEMNRKEPDMQVHTMQECTDIGTGSKGAANKAANVSQRKAIGTASVDYDDMSRN